MNGPTTKNTPSSPLFTQPTTGYTDQERENYHQLVQGSPTHQDDRFVGTPTSPGGGARSVGSLEPPQNVGGVNTSRPTSPNSSFADAETAPIMDRASFPGHAVSEPKLLEIKNDKGKSIVRLECVVDGVTSNYSITLPESFGPKLFGKCNDLDANQLKYLGKMVYMTQLHGEPQPVISAQVNPATGAFSVSDGKGPFHPVEDKTIDGDPEVVEPKTLEDGSLSYAIMLHAQMKLYLALMGKKTGDAPVDMVITREPEEQAQAQQARAIEQQQHQVEIVREDGVLHDRQFVKVQTEAEVARQAIEQQRADEQARMRDEQASQQSDRTPRVNLTRENGNLTLPSPNNSLASSFSLSSPRRREVVRGSETGGIQGGQQRNDLVIQQVD